MRGVTLVALLAVALVACTASQAEPTSTTSLRIAYWENPGREPDVVWTLRCNPARGTLPRPVRACTRLMAGGVTLFAPLPPSMVCTQIYGGPQQARIVGSVGGKRVWTTLTRTDGCQIGRWAKLSPWLLPPGGVT
jgi:hypothetical protein